MLLYPVVKAVQQCETGDWPTTSIDSLPLWPDMKASNLTLIGWEIIFVLCTCPSRTKILERQNATQEWNEALKNLINADVIEV